MSTVLTLAFIYCLQSGICYDVEIKVYPNKASYEISYQESCQNPVLRKSYNLEITDDYHPNSSLRSIPLSDIDENRLTSEILKRSGTTLSDEEVSDLVCKYRKLGDMYGMNWIIMLAQNFNETGWLGSTWAEEYYNFAGIGVSGVPGQGKSFQSIEDGVTYHYACMLNYAYAKEEMNSFQKELSDQCPVPFSYQGIASHNLRGLSGTWAAVTDYNSRISRETNYILDMIK